jgi:hypothetical protein
MATTSTLGAFGIKEVADVRFYRTSDVTYNKATADTKAYIAISEGAQPELEFTTLKVSNIEFTAEQTDAKGGKGNLPLITWDYGREVNLTLEDALLSMDCLRALFGSKKAGDNDHSIVIGGSTFPGNYAIVGVTYARDQENGDDHLFTFFVPNAKMGSEITLNMEAEGDPTVFSMNMKALRASKEDDMMIALLADDAVYDKSTDIFDAALANPNADTDET